jgi:hypothetical protein
MADYSLKDALSKHSSMPMHEADDSADDGMDETEAAKGLLAAIKSGDPEELAMAFKEMRRACDYSHEAESDNADEE